MYIEPSINRFPKRKPVFKFGKKLEVSIQANQYTYCEPRDNVGPYISVELGFPNFKSKILKQYAENPEALYATVYGNVPVEVVIEALWIELEKEV